MSLFGFFAGFRRRYRRLLVKISYDRIRPALEDKKLDNEIKISIFNTMISSAFQPNLH